MAVMVEGSVVRRRYAAGSKSDHMAVMVRLQDGRFLLLRRRGGNPFADPVLQALVDRRLRLWGEVVDNLLFVERWEELTPPRPPPEA